MKKKKFILHFLMILVLSACGHITRMTGSKMDKLELGMSKEQVISILGKGYTIAEKRVEDGAEIEVLSYQNFYNSDEFYLFQFANDKLEKWYRELQPKIKTSKD